MLAYAANNPAIGRRQSSPNALLIVIGAHVAALAALMSARMELPLRQHEPPIIIETIRQPEPPKPIEQPRTTPRSQEPNRPTTTTVDSTEPRVTPLDPPELLTGTSSGDPGPTIELQPPPRPLPIITPVKMGLKLITPASELKPPYPPSKILTEEEAVLTLRLTIDDRGHVVAVDPVGRADRAFVEAARRHVIAHWRYQPANEDGRAIASSLVVTLRFMLDG